MLNSRINKELEKMTIEEKYKLLEIMEEKHLGANEKYDTEFMENIVNLILDSFTLLAKIFHII